MNINKSLIFISALLFSTITFAEGWCNLKQGFNVITHGTKTDNTYIIATIEGREDSMWIFMSDGNVGKNNVSLALAAQLAGKTLSIYLDAEGDTCSNFPSWAPVGRVRHVRLL